MEVYILSPDIEILGVFSVYEAIVWNPKLHEPGTIKAQFLYSSKINDVMQLGNLLYKTDEDEAAIITRKYIKSTKDGSEYLQVEGYMASRYLNRRIIWSKMVMSGTPEEVMRRMVKEQVIEPTIADRKMPRIRLGELKGYGGNLEKQITYDNLQEALTDVSKTSELGYRLRLDVGEKLFYFEVYQGVDRTQGSEYPCIFTRDYNNVYTQEYSEDDSNYRNICLVGGKGEDADRILEIVGGGSGIDRFEMFYNAAGLSDKDITAAEYRAQLRTKGQEKLAGYYIATAYESKINQDKAMTYALGDYVTCIDSKWNTYMNTQIKAISKGYSKTERSTVVTFGDDAPTLIETIKAKE